jgi:hypothetical protein
VGDMMSGLLSGILGLEPFDPSKHDPQDLGLGGVSTEYLATDYDEKGRVINYPTVWFDRSGKAYFLPKAALSLALDYEAATGKRFPRFDNTGEAVERAEHRSAMGGALASPPRPPYN